MNEVAVRRVNLNTVKTCSLSALCGRRKGVNHAVNIIFCHFPRQAFGFSARDGGRRFNRKAALLKRQKAAFFPGNRTASLAARVRELNHEFGLGAYGAAFRGERLKGLVPEPETRRRDAALRRHGRCFHNDEPGTRPRQFSIMHPVPGLKHPVFGAVLAHRRHTEAVHKLQFSQCER